MTEKEIEMFLGELGNNVEGEAAIKKVSFPPLDSLQQARTMKTSLAHLEDIKITISAELGDKILKFREVLNLDVGSIINLDKSAGDAINIYINEQKVALGEIIVVNDGFAVRFNTLDPPKNLRREGSNG
ncbi:FliM/FliN family flagellar motor switch protein [Desulforamulus aquiferis]|uniref:FliM/FliN family flagellar motor switch protein n=1 Tax=Desulforamulus aquiferis TaxID=1397668 RepID=A0AAW7ZFX5_9FIRM|nr:FliM/FliN family flagellar motor switch protein [Desulforamulus aquiferis]MDO7788375.1 FliM/FliN family flagellar motor switch protein [Desulforamulus aquiferis]RYD03086.1 hypothetical protein N752_21995 [Desulforamulus aquiferis]